MPVGLVVEDEQHLGEMLRELLVGTHPGYRWEVARSEDEALTLLRSTQVAFVLLDLMLYGHEAARLVEYLAGRPDITVVLTSGVTPSAGAEMARSVGFHWVSKPFTSQDLLPYLTGRVPRRSRIAPAQHSAARIEYRVESFWEKWPGAFTLVERGAIARVNSNWRRILGYAPEDVVGQPLTAYLEPDEVPGFLAALESSKITGDPWKFTGSVRTRDGNRVFLVWEGSRPTAENSYFATALEV